MTDTGFQMKLTQAIEDYLKKIYKLQYTEKGATTSNIAKAMNVSSASVTNMLKRLSKMNLVDYNSYKGVTLTDTGRKTALETIRHHRLLELYLVEKLNYTWDEVHEEADILEHYISEKLEDRIAEVLEDPSHDPHGDPIPAKDGKMPVVDWISMNDSEKHQEYLIRRVREQKPEILQYLEQIGILPGVKVKIKEIGPFDGPITVDIEGREEVIGNNIAGKIYLVNYE